MVCGSNMNRSMEAHLVFRKAGMDVESFGVGQHVKLPGAAQNRPNVYEFGTPYTNIYEDLKSKDAELYTRNGLLRMLERNIATKRAPERWQDCREVFDVAFTFETRVMETLCDDMANRVSKTSRPLLVINMDVRDNHEESAVAAPLALKLCRMIEAAEEWEDEIDDIITKFEAETGRKVVYTILYY